MDLNSKDTCNDILFLGEWCKTYSYKKNPKVKSKTLNYHWDDRNKLENDFLYLEDLYKKVLVSLSKKLNFIHKKNYDPSFWEIIIGFWLHNFLHVVFDRWEVLSKLDSSKEYFLNHFDYNLDRLMVNNSYDSIHNFTKDYWNSYMFREILKYRYSINCSQTPQVEKVTKKEFYKKKSFIVNFYLKIFSFLSKKNTSVILDVKLSLYDMIILFFKTNSLYFPTKVYDEITESEYDEKKRNWKLKFNSSNEFEIFLSKIISYHLPKVFIEGYNNILIELNKSLLPKSPKNILSLNCFFKNDFFSFYMALAKMNGAKILTWQHGGHFGIGKFSVYENYQVSISDKFFSWGWNNKNNNVIPLGYFKKPKGKNKFFKSKESVLYVNTMYPRYSWCIYSTPISSSQNIRYFDSQINFFKNLDKTIFSKMIIKLPNYNHGWNIKARFRDSFPGINIYNGKKSALSLINKVKLTICSYNGTFFLESLANNIPTIIFMDKEYFELNKESIPMFKILKKHLIFHETSLSAANHLNLIYDKVDEWWYEENLQKSLKKFIYSYCRSYKIDKLISSLNE